MRNILTIEEETASMNLTLAQVLPRDFAATEEIFRSFSNFLHTYGAFLNSDRDISPDIEAAFQNEHDKVINFILDSTNRIHALLNN